MGDVARAVDGEPLGAQTQPLPPHHDVEVGDRAADEARNHRGLAREVGVLTCPQRPHVACAEAQVQTLASEDVEPPVDPVEA